MTTKIYRGSMSTRIVASLSTFLGVNFAGSGVVGGVGVTSAAAAATAGTLSTATASPPLEVTSTLGGSLMATEIQCTEHWAARISQWDGNISEFGKLSER